MGDPAAEFHYSRAILSSALCQKADLASFLPVLYSAIERYGAPETFVTDSGSIFLANRAQKIYEALGVEKVEIEKGKPWQSYIETTFNTQRRMADYHFSRAQSWEELLASHEQWIGDYNAQRHWAHQHRQDGLGLQRFDGHFFTLGHSHLLNDSSLVISRTHVAY